MIISFGQEPKKKTKDRRLPDKVKVDTTVTVVRPMQIDSIQMEQQRQMRELDKLVEKTKKK